MRDLSKENKQIGFGSEPANLTPRLAFLNLMVLIMNYFIERHTLYIQSQLFLTTTLPCRHNGPHFTNKGTGSQGDYIIVQRQISKM